MKILGIVLIVLGLLGFVFGSFTFTETNEVVDLGPVEVETEQERTIPITPIASGIAVAAGVVLVVAASRKPKT